MVVSLPPLAQVGITLPLPRLPVRPRPLAPFMPVFGLEPPMVDREHVQLFKDEAANLLLLVFKQGQPRL
jgi:hypothetical protein